MPRKKKERVGPEPVPVAPFPKPFFKRTLEYPRRAQAVASFLLANPDREAQLCGLVEISPLEILRALPAGWTQEHVDGALGELEEADFLVREGGWMFLTWVLEYDPPAGESRAKNAAKRLKLAPRHKVLWPALIDVARIWAPELMTELRRVGVSGTEGGTHPGWDPDSDPGTQSGPENSGDNAHGGTLPAGTQGPGPRLMSTPGGMRDTTPDPSASSPLSVFGGGA